MSLHQEPIAEAIARADKSLMFEADNGEENGPYDAGVFKVERPGLSVRGERMSIDGRTLTVFFPVELQPGDTIFTPRR